MHVVIIGNGAAGVTAAFRIREHQPNWEITMISGESNFHYSRPALMYIYMGHMRYQDTKPIEDHVWTDKKITLLRDWVIDIDTQGKELKLHAQGTLAFDRLIISTGSKPNKFGWPGQDLKGVQGLWGLYDLKLLQENAVRTKTAVIVGGGLIGIEMAEMLHFQGIHVIFLVREKSYWNHILPPEESALINKVIVEQGIELRLETELKEIVDDGQGQVGGIITTSGEKITCQLVGLTAGVSPNCDMVKETSVETNRGILVDRSLQTSATDIWAAGDCAEIKMPEGERNQINQVWYTAKMQGEIAGDNVAGISRSYEPPLWYNSAKFFDLEYHTYGQVNLDLDQERNLVWQHPTEPKILRIVHNDANETIGIQSMGIRLRHRVCESWINEKRPPSWVLKHLNEANFDPEFYQRHEDEIRSHLGGTNSMIDPQLLNYDFNEEENGFAAPQAAVSPSPVSAKERLAGAMIALGSLGLILQISVGIFLGTWLGFALSYGLLASGALVIFLARFQGTHPGIKHDNTMFRGIQNRGLLGWMLGIAITGFYVVLYFYDDLQKDWGMPPLLERPTEMLNPLAQLLAKGDASRWFLYGFLYTVAVCVFGFRMLLKYRHNNYQRIRTMSVMFFQFGFAFLLPNLLKAFSQPEFYFTYFWPLKPEYLFPSNIESLRSSAAIGTFMVFWGVLATFVLTPILTWRFGKRWYCSWVCGCGGLAETLGDPWRQQSSNSQRSWKIERWTIHTVLVLITILTIGLWFDLGTWTEGYKKSYGFFVGAIFSGVIGVGFYPLLGSRVWCRFGCPMAAILGILQRVWSRFRITTNGDQCMSCGNCSTYCEMGIDVRGYAEKGLNIVRASCVGCGICAAVCPRGVLGLENGMSPSDRFDGAQSPLLALTESIKASTIIPERETMFPGTCGSVSCQCKDSRS